jgi:gliding motility-associated-like protein
MKFTLFIFILSSNYCFSQLVVNNSQVVLTSGVQVIVNGGFENNLGNLLNNGFLQITRLSTYSSPGDFKIEQFASVSGDGYYKVEQNWINNNIFVCDTSTVELYGNLKQLITSDNSTITNFHNLILTGNGIGENRKKELLNVNSGTDYSGQLFLNNRELATLTNSFYVQNPSNSSIYFDNTFQDEGMVSSIEPGYLWRSTNSISNYFFPLGSSNGMRRFRPVLVTTLNANPNYFGGRLNNYDSNSDSFDRNLTDSQSKDLNPFFYHSLVGNEVGISDAGISIGYLYSDGIFDGISNWSNLNNYWSSFENEDNSTIGNYVSLHVANIDLNNLFHPYILSNKDLSSDVYVPNAFTPDGQEFNNVFAPVFSSNDNISEIELYIFDRWGELIFEGYGSGVYWDGYLDEYKCQDGVYTWKLNYSKNGYKSHLVGHVNLLK